MNSKEVIVTGKCYCEETTFTAKPPTVRSCLCHCKDCRKAHSAPLYNCAYFPKQYFTILKGQSNLKYFQGENKNLKRWFCSNCGTRLFNEFIKDDIEEIGIFPNTLESIPDIYKPQYHVWTSQSILSMKLFENDNLPKYEFKRIPLK